MIREKSCGAVIFMVSGGRRLYLVERMVKGHTSICKGHVEGAETERETAAREICEETSLRPRFIDGFRRTIEYAPYEGCVKEVVFFLAESDCADTVPQPEEVTGCQWLPLEDALTELTHRSDRETVLAADRFLAGRAAPPDRPMRRHDRELTREQCERLLDGGFDGVLCLHGDGGWPYGVPLSYVYREGKIFFHGAKAGHRLDAARRDPRASFCVVTQDLVIPRQYTTDYRSVIAFGTVRELTERAEKRDALRALAEKYGPEGPEEREGRERYVDAELDHACVLELTVLRLTGKARSGME